MRCALLLFLASTSLLQAAEPNPLTADALLDRVIVRPGNFDQMCDAPEPISPKVPLPIYTFVLNRELHPSEEDYAELRARRAEIIPALIKRLADIDFITPAPPIEEYKFKEVAPGSGLTPENPAEEEKVENSGISPKHLSGLLFEIIIALDAVETLPELLRIEERLRSLIAAADVEGKGEPPTVEIDGFLNIPEDKKPSDRSVKFLKARIIQRELLSLMLQLLRRQHYQPLLASNLEKQYAKAIKARAKEEDLRDFKTPADAKAKGEDWVKFDPIVKVPLSYMPNPPSVPFSREVREQIRSWAKDFTASVPPEKWRVNPELP